MNGPLAWVDGLLALCLFGIGFTLLVYLFRNDSPDRTSS